MNRRSFMRGLALAPLGIVPGWALAQQKHATGGVVGPELFIPNGSRQIRSNIDIHRLMKDMGHRLADIMIKQKEAQAIAENTPFLTLR